MSTKTSESRMIATTEAGGSGHFNQTMGEGQGRGATVVVPNEGGGPVAPGDLLHLPRVVESTGQGFLA